jgi:hypothetical protein
MSLGIKTWTETLMFNSKNLKIMKSIFYIVMVLFLSANFTSCTSEALTDEVEEVAIVGEDGELGGEDDDGTGD